MLRINSPCPLSHPVPGWRLRVSRQSTTPISTCQGTGQRRVGGVGSTDQPACRPLPGAPGLAGAGFRERLAGSRPCGRQRCYTHKEGWALPQILGSSVSYRVAVGPHQGRKAFMIRTIRPLDRPDPGLERVAKANGFSLHAGVSCEGHQKNKRERLCRYISRPAVAVPRLSLSSTGKVVYTLKTPYRDGTTQVAFDRGGHPPVDFVARLAALIPKPRVNLTRYHGVLAPNHRWRGLVTPAKRGKGVKSISNAEIRSTAERHAAMTWAQRLKRVFNIDIEVCARCGGSVRVIVGAPNRCLEDQDVIPDKAGQALDRILAHLHAKEQNTPTLPHLAPPTRAPPETLALFVGKGSSTTALHQQGSQ